MRTDKRMVLCVRLVAALLGAIAALDCSSGSPTQPTGATFSASGLALASTSMAVGHAEQGTITLAAPASAAGAIISLSSSNTAVATVQTPVTIPSGTSSVTFTVTAVAAGTTTITASYNGTSVSSALTVTVPAATLGSISLSVSTVVGGNSAIGLATLTGVAPTGGAVVALSATDPATVPATVTVPAGSTSAVFTVSTHSVAAATGSTITGAYGGSSTSALLSVTPFVAVVATANFGVTGTSITDTCNLINGGTSLDCTFDGSSSTAPGTIVAWDWSYTVATTIAQTTQGPKLTIPMVTCALMPPPPLPAGDPWFTMTVTLTIHDSLGNVSAKAVDGGVRLLPQGACGY